MSKFRSFPKQQLPFSRKTKKWRKECVDWADDKTFSTSSLVRKTVVNKQINYDLVNGKVHMSDMVQIVNPDNIQGSFIPEKIPHYPIMNSKLNVLIGEESKRPFDYRVIVTNPNAISEIEKNKKAQLDAQIRELIANTAQSEEEFNQELEKVSDYFTYEWQDRREIMCNALLSHYSKEYDFNYIFNTGFKDGLIVGEEVYQCDIVGGEPTLERINNVKLRVFRSGYSNRIEDADVIIIEDYWSIGKIFDHFYEVLSPKDRKYLEDLPNNLMSGSVDEMGNYDERKGFVTTHMVSDIFGDSYTKDDIFAYVDNDNCMPYDVEGNVRVVKVYWKSKRMVKKVKYYDISTGEVLYKLMPETYIPNKNLGEEVTTIWINEAWEGTKIGDDIYVNMRPRPIQYNTIDNPSRCHFGIVGTIYNLNDDRPFSLVDMMKQYSYLYDCIHDRLNKMIARNWGKLIQLDLAKVPSGWEIEKWMYYAKVNGLVVTDSFKEGNIGAATGKLAGGLNNASSGVIDAEFGNSIQSQINLLEFIKMEMSDVAGISRQREGQISNRETVGGVERATLQSSHITEQLFTIHENTKKRVIECFLETAKVALKGKIKKFNYIMPNDAKKLITLDGDEFAESSYGIVVDNSSDRLKLQSQLESLAQAALQNHALSFSTIMKIYSSGSIAEKQRMIEHDENKLMERQQQSQQQELQQRQQEAEMQQQVEMAKMQQEDMLNQRDNETKILVATISAESKERASDSDGIVEPMSEAERAKLNESIRQFNERLQLDKDRLAFDKDKAETDARLKEKQINSKPKTTSK